MHHDGPSPTMPAALPNPEGRDSAPSGADEEHEMALDPAGQQELLDRIMAIFTNEADATAFGEDPEGYIDENLPEDAEEPTIRSGRQPLGKQTCTT